MCQPEYMCQSAEHLAHPTFSPWRLPLKGILKIWGVCVCLCQIFVNARLVFRVCVEAGVFVCTCMRRNVYKIVLFYAVQRPFPGEKMGFNKSCCSVFKETFVWSWRSDMIDHAGISFAHKREMTAHAALYFNLSVSLCPPHILILGISDLLLQPCRGEIGPTGQRKPGHSS